ncbi:MAG: dTDP-4-dehydrorhamnose reductase [Betaproteobacteria bacterium]|nr:dTDP-4-dehydrorhamnose reductase [Betaproteobacteria bacterium]
MRILLTGKTGQIGGKLVAALGPLGELLACDRRRLDLADRAAISSVVREFAPDVIVNAAAYTAVDQAESEPALAMAVNATAPGILADEALRIGAVLVHYSTDYVFDGRKKEPYTEDDATNPLNAYGRTKLAGEDAIRASGARHLILRTSWVYDASGKNFFVTIRRLAAERDELKIVNDQIGAPTWCRHIATATAAILARLVYQKELRSNDVSGVYNLTAEGAASWHEFAAAILADRTVPPTEHRARLTPIPTSDYPTAAMRPHNSVLTHDKVQRTFGVRMPTWQAGLRACLDAQAQTLKD